jgi:hypothetical protein
MLLISKTTGRTGTVTVSHYYHTDEDYNAVEALEVFGLKHSILLF